MELIGFFLAVTLVGVSAYLLSCAVFCLFTSRSLQFAFAMAWKLPFISMLGLPLFGFGGIALASVVFLTQLRKMEDYRPVRDITAALMITSACTVLIVYCGMLLAFEILE